MNTIKLNYAAMFFVTTSFFTIFEVPNLSAQSVDDPPAIQVFPEQDQIGTSKLPMEQLISDGESLFRTRFNLADGAGRPLSTGDSKPTPRVRSLANFNRIAGPDAAACSSCHNSPANGGSGDAAANVFVGAHFSDPPTTSTATSITNERNTSGLFGSGQIELLASEISKELGQLRAQGLQEAKKRNDRIVIPLKSKGISFGSILISPNGYIDYKGLEGIDYDLIVKPFGIKGVIISLREFAVGALNQHHGIQAIERFGWERTGVEDFDGDGIINEFTLGQVTALTLFQAQLHPPVQKWSAIPDERAKQRNGQQTFQKLRCAECHIPQLTLNSPLFTEPNEFNRPGALSAKYIDTVKLDLSGDLEKSDEGKWGVNAYTDLKRHDMCDDDIKYLCNEERKQDNVGLELFMTQKLWDAATSSPYCHRGDCSTLTEAIWAHGGEGRASRDAYLKLPVSERRDLISFILTLGLADQKETSP